MTDQLLDRNSRLSELSVAYVKALAAKTGYTTATPTLDRDSVDLTINTGGGMRPSLALQLKATSGLVRKDGKAGFRLHRKNYDDLRNERVVPWLLVVLEVPDNESEWANFGPDCLEIRRCAWWLHLAGEPEIDNDSKTVYLIDSQRFEPDSVRMLIQQVRERIL